MKKESLNINKTLLLEKCKSIYGVQFHGTSYEGTVTVDGVKITHKNIDSYDFELLFVNSVGSVYSYGHDGLVVIHYPSRYESDNHITWGLDSINYAIKILKQSEWDEKHFWKW